MQPLQLVFRSGIFGQAGNILVTDIPLTITDKEWDNLLSLTFGVKAETVKGFGMIQK